MAINYMSSRRQPVGGAKPKASRGQAMVSRTTTSARAGQVGTKTNPVKKAGLMANVTAVSSRGAANASARGLAMRANPMKPRAKMARPASKASALSRTKRTR